MDYTQFLVLPFAVALGFSPRRRTGETTRTITTGGDSGALRLDSESGIGGDCTFS